MLDFHQLLIEFKWNVDLEISERTIFVFARDIAAFSFRCENPSRCVNLLLWVFFE